MKITTETKRGMAALVIIPILIFLFRKCNDEPTAPVSLYDSSVVYKQLPSGSIAAVNKVTTLTKEQVDQLVKENEDLKALVKKGKNVVTRTVVKVEYRDRTITLPGTRDTITKALSTRWADSCISATVKVDSMETFHITYKLKPQELYLTQYLSKNDSLGWLKRIFSHKDLYAAAEVKGCGIVTTQKVIAVKPPEKRLSVGLQAGGGITTKGPGLYAGFGIGYRIW